MGFEPARERYIASQKPNALPTELSGRPEQLRNSLKICKKKGGGMVSSSYRDSMHRGSSVSNMLSHLTTNSVLSLPVYLCPSLYQS